MAKNSIERKAKRIPFLFAPGAQNSVFSFNFLDSSKIRIENMANAIPVIKGKNPEYGDVGVPIFSFRDPIHIAMERKRRNMPDIVSYLLISSTRYEIIMDI